MAPPFIKLSDLRASNNPSNERTSEAVDWNANKRQTFPDGQCDGLEVRTATGRPLSTFGYKFVISRLFLVHLPSPL
jgi:hypothetical protein